MDDLHLVESFPGLGLDDLWTAWTTPDGVTSFWAEEAEIDLVPGGPYRLAWPSRSWTMDGEVLAVDPGTALAFTWAWSHEPDAPTRRVDLGFSAAGDDDPGSRLAIDHGPYGPDDAEERTGHEEGWRFFCRALRERG